MIRVQHALLLSVLFLFAGCQNLSQSNDSSLYNALGKRSGIEQIVEDMLYRVVDDPRIAFQFKGIDVVQLHQGLSDHLCELSGGPCTYNGRDMREAHKTMNITETQFNALTENLVLAMEKNRIPTGTQNRLLALLAPLHHDVRGL